MAFIKLEIASIKHTIDFHDFFTYNVEMLVNLNEIKCIKPDASGTGPQIVFYNILETSEFYKHYVQNYSFIELEELLSIKKN